MVFLGVRINFILFWIVLGVLAGIVFGAPILWKQLDRRDLARWNNPDSLRQASGVIYSCRPMLSYFDFQHGVWVQVPNAPEMLCWDIAGKTCVYHGYEGYTGEFVFISRMPEFRAIHKLSAKALINYEHISWQGIKRIAISPDESKVALLYPMDDVIVPKDTEGFYDAGSKCLILVLDTDTGETLARVSRWALGYDLCWMQDGRHLLFYSLDDTALFDHNATAAQMKGPRHIIHPGASGKFAGGLYSFDCITDEIKRFSDGYEPSLAVETGQILLRNGDEVRLLESDGRLSKRFRITNLGWHTLLVSPRGNLILAGIEPRSPHNKYDFVTVLAVNDPGLRHTIDDGSYYRGISFWTSYKWANE